MWSKRKGNISELVEETNFFKLILFNRKQNFAGNKMDIKFLFDYEEREKDEIKKFRQRFNECKIRHNERYPSKHRLELSEPFTKSIDGEKIWNQIPLYGTTIIKLKPTRKEIFEKVHGFDIEDIDRLIDFSKETGRIQFALAENPTNYIEMDFLEPIFNELKPPKLIYIPLNWILTDKKILDSSCEIESLVENSQFNNFINDFIEKKYPKPISQNVVKKGIIYDLIRLKMLGYGNTIKDFIQSLSTIETNSNIFLQESIHDLFLYPYDPLGGIASFKRIDINKIHSKFPFGRNMPKEIEFPYEIGKFLNDNLKLIIPKNLDGAIDLIDEYNLYDLRKVMNALNNGIANEKMDIIIEKSDDLSSIFINVWNEADKLKKRVNIARHAISFSCGVVGAAATMPIGGVGGLLTGLGFNVGDKMLDENKSYESISEKILKFGSQSYITHVYDFKKKHKLF